MKTMTLIAKALDVTISLSLLLTGMYLFFWDRDYVSGAIVIASHSAYQIPTVLMKGFKFDKK